MQKLKLFKIGMLLSISLFSFALGSCSLFLEKVDLSDPPQSEPAFTQKQIAQSVQEERDMIFSLAAYVVVFNDWQSSEKSSARGHNIGCILVNSSDDPVAWNRNCSGKATNNSTQHGEVRCIQSYIQSSGNKYLDGYTVYTTLEPCAMCSGMMCLTKVTRCVYGQTDENYPDGSAGYGRAIERLRFDSSKSGGYKPYPRAPAKSEPSISTYRNALDWRFSNGTESNITAFLTSERAREIYEAAKKHFDSFEVQFPENSAIYKKTVDLVRSSAPTP